MTTGKHVTMSDIARLAGVSRPAVSAALSGKPSTIAVSKETRERILRISEELGYQRNMLAQSFIKQKSFLLSFIDREEHFVYALETTRGIQDSLNNTDYSMLLFLHGNNIEDQARHIRHSLARKVEGLIIAPSPEREPFVGTQQLRALYANGFAMVQVYRKWVPEIPVVMTDEQEVGRLATRHLLELGHKRIAHYTYDQYKDQAFPGESFDALQRYQGYEKTMRDAGLEPLVVTFPTSSYAGDGYSYGARQYARAVAEHPAGITAVTTFADFVALGLLKGLKDCGVRVPEDISVVGYDDVEAAAVLEPALTTLRPRCRELGHCAVKHIFAQLRGEKVTDQLFSPTLVNRASTAKPRD